MNKLAKETRCTCILMKSFDPYEISFKIELLSLTFQYFVRLPLPQQVLQHWGIELVRRWQVLVSFSCHAFIRLFCLQRLTTLDNFCEVHVEAIRLAAQEPWHCEPRESSLTSEVCNIIKSILFFTWGSNGWWKTLKVLDTLGKNKLLFYCVERGTRENDISYTSVVAANYITFMNDKNSNAPELLEDI